MPRPTLALAAAAIAATLAALPVHASAPPAAGEPMPALELATDDGPLSLAAHRGRVVWLDYWASWCGPCKRSFPWMNAMHERYGAKGLTVVAVNVDARTPDARRFLADHPARFRVAFDPAGETARRLAIRAMPTSVLIGPDGRVLAVHRGFRDSDADALEASIRDALDRLPSPAAAR